MFAPLLSFTSFTSHLSFIHNLYLIFTLEFHQFCKTSQCHYNMQNLCLSILQETNWQLLMRFSVCDVECEEEEKKRREKRERGGRGSEGKRGRGREKYERVLTIYRSIYNEVFTVWRPHTHLTRGFIDGE